MNKEKLSLLKDYIKAGLSPIFIKNIPSDSFNNSVIISSKIDRLELNGHYENTDFCPPTWYKELIEKSKNDYCFLVIENINEIKPEEQTKFIEIFNYKKISTFRLPENCLIVVTGSDVYDNKIDEEVDSLLSPL